MKVHLVDGTFELFRAYYGAPGARAPDGTEVGATRGFVRSLLSLLSRRDVTHIACAFDTVIESFRNDLFDGYKTGEGIEPELFSQFPLVEQAALAAGVVVWRMDGPFETDDAIATAAARFAEEPGVEQVVICSPDKDFAQCVRGHRVVLWDRIRDHIRDEDGVREKWGITPGSMPDWLALVGDSADGIPGVPRWGAKSASTVLCHYGAADRIPRDPATWEVAVRGARGLSESLEAHRDKLGLYRTLATLRTDVPLAERLEDLRWRGARREAMAQLSERLGTGRFSVPRYAD